MGQALRTQEKIRADRLGEAGLFHHSQEFLLTDLTVPISVRLVDHFLGSSLRSQHTADLHVCCRVCKVAYQTRSFGVSK